jgi:hypothetical protein
MLRRLLAVVLVLVGALVAAGPAAAAPCTTFNCYQYWADVSITDAWTTALNTPVVPGTMHSYTVKVTNTGWRTGGLQAPMPWPTGPASGTVYVGFEPGIAYGEKPWGGHVDSGPPYGFFGGYNGGLAFDTGSIPNNATYQLTVYFFAPMTPGGYTFRIWLYPFQGANPWTDYNPNNNEAFLNFQVG